MSFRSSLLVAALAGALACSQKAETTKKADDAKATADPSTASASTSTSAADDSTLDDENTGADSPAQVSGAFLADCEVVGDPIDGITPADGEAIGGCTLRDSQSKERPGIKSGTLKISLSAENGSEVLPESVWPPEGSEFDFYVKTPPEWLSRLVVNWLSFVDDLGQCVKYGEDDKTSLECINAVGWDNFGSILNNLNVKPTQLKPLPEDGKHLIFPTQKFYPASFGGLDGADVICAEAGKTADQSREWLALLSTSAVNARDRLEIKGPIYNLMAELVAPDAATLWGTGSGATLVHPISFTELGTDTGEPVIDIFDADLKIGNVWTGTGTDGRLSDKGNCKDWTSVELEEHASDGSSYEANTEWVASGSPSSCSHMARLYCISK